MAVALLTKTHLDCSVAFWDVREDLRHPPRAAVSIGSPRQWGYDIDPLGLLVPLVAIRHVHNLGARSLPFAGSFMEMLGGMADELLEGAAVAQAFKARTAPAALATAAAADMWFERTGEPMAAEKLITGIPELTLEGTMHTADRVVSMRLASTREKLWAKIKPPRAGPALFGAEAVFALIEYAARQGDYMSVALPAAAAISELARTHRQVFEMSEGTKAAFTGRDLSLGEQKAREIALSADPIAALGALRPTSSKAAFGTGPDDHGTARADPLVAAPTAERLEHLKIGLEWRRRLRAGGFDAVVIDVYGHALHLTDRGWSPELEHACDLAPFFLLSLGDGEDPPEAEARAIRLVASCGVGFGALEEPLTDDIPADWMQSAIDHFAREIGDVDFWSAASVAAKAFAATPRRERSLPDPTGMHGLGADVLCAVAELTASEATNEVTRQFGVAFDDAPKTTAKAAKNFRPGFRPPHPRRPNS